MNLDDIGLTHVKKAGLGNCFSLNLSGRGGGRKGKGNFKKGWSLGQKKINFISIQKSLFSKEIT